MKKLLTLLLVVLMCLGCMTLVACGNNDTDTDTDSTPAEPSNLDNAVEYVFSMYNSGLGDEAAKLEKDLTVIASVIVEKDTFNVEWSVEITKGAADAVKVVDGANNTKTIDIPDYNDEQIEFTLKATVKDADGKTGDVSFKYYIPVRVKQEIDSAKKIVLKYIDTKDDNKVKYVTGTHYLYTSSSSGKQKWELELTENLAEALAIVVQENSDNTISFVAEGKYLSCDANNVQFVDSQDDNTKFVLEPATNGTYIKCAVANYNGSAQYLEVYSGYLTCYGMNASSDTNIFTFSFVDADNTVAGTIVIPDNTDKPGDDNTGDDNTGDDNTGNEPTTGKPVLEAVTPVVGTAYKLGFVQGNLNKAFYLTGAMSSFYMASTENFADAVDFYIEATEGGYSLYCMVGEAKKYVNIKAVTGTDGKEHINATYDDSTSTVYTYDETLKTFVTKVNNIDYVLGTRTDKEFSTLGPMKTDNECFVAVFVTKAATNVKDDDNTGDDNTGDEPTTGKPVLEAVTPVVGTAYKLGFVQGNLNKAFYLTGAMSSFYMASTENFADAVDFYIEATEGGYSLYCMVGEAKKYVNIKAVTGTDGKEHINATYDDSTSTVYTYDETLKTLVTKVNNIDYVLGTKTDKEFSTLGPMKTDNECFVAVFVTKAATNVEDDDNTGDDNTGDDNTGDDTTGGDNTGDVIPEKIVIKYVKDDVIKYVTGKHYLYEGKTSKWELEFTENLAEALVITVVKNDDATISFVAEGKYLFCNGTDVKFVDTQDDNTKFVLEDATNGKFIKCAVANFNGNAQYLEEYSGYLTCYRMTETASIYTFDLIEADDTSKGTIVIPEPHVCTEFSDATCTAPKTCKECGATEGKALGHNYVDGACSVCGAKEPVAGETILPSNLSFTGLANNSSADTYLKNNFSEWTITGNLGNGYGGYLGFGRKGDTKSAITSSAITTNTAFTVTAVIKGNGSNGDMTSTLTFTLVDAEGNLVATGYANGSTTAAITPVDKTDTTYNISFTFEEGKTWSDVSNLVVSFNKTTGNIGLKSLDFIQ